MRANVSFWTRRQCIARYREAMSAPRTYLDAGGSAPLTARTRDALLAGLADGWADPARLSSESRRARALVEGSREALADALGARPELVHFT